MILPAEKSGDTAPQGESHKLGHKADTKGKALIYKQGTRKHDYSFGKAATNNEDIDLPRPDSALPGCAEQGDASQCSRSWRPDPVRLRYEVHLGFQAAAQGRFSQEIQVEKKTKFFFKF